MFTCHGANITGHARKSNLALYFVGHKMKHMLVLIEIFLVQFSQTSYFYHCIYPSKGHVALDRQLGPGFNTLLLQMIPGDLLSACPHR